MVKNIPKHLTEERFREHFQSMGEVTDAKIQYTSQTTVHKCNVWWGTSRRFGFIGFRTEKEAIKALKHFNDTYMDTCKITVQAGDANIPRPWSKHTLRKQEQTAPTPSNKEAFKVIQAEPETKIKVRDVQLEDFLEAMQAKSNIKSWAEEAPTESTAKPDTAVAPLQPSSNVVHDTKVSDLDYLKSKMKTDDVTPETQEESIVEPEVDVAEQQIMETGRLFVRNLAFSATEDDLKSLFEQHGPVSEIHLPIAKGTKLPIGIALVTFLLPEHALKAYYALDRFVFQGRLMHILPGKDKLQKSLEEQLEEASSFKQKRDIKKKANASSQFNWNMLYMNADAVTDAIASKLSVNKSDILDRDANNLAVRLALAETQVINDTKDYFLDNGVDLDSLRHVKERSDNVILVKNIPHETSESELRELFGSFGQLGKVLIPPAKTIAVVEFLEATEGKTAFRHLAYRKFKNTILYLEKAPAGFFSSTVTKRVAKVQDSAMDVEEDVEGDRDNCTLFVKNLNFATKEKDLTSVFEVVGPLRAVTVRTKQDPKHPDKRLSMGFGFVEFKHTKDAKHALASLQGVYLDGHALQLKLSDRPTKETTSKIKDKAASTKIVIRNIPFEATKKDVKELFSNYAQVKSIRLPKKYDGNHRGFAFIEFLTKKEAERAKTALSATHLYGRHLVIEYADDVEDVETARDQVRKQLERDTVAQSKKRRKIEEDEEEDEF